MAIRMLALTVSALALASCATAPVPTYAPGAPFDGTIARSVAENYDARVVRAYLLTAPLLGGRQPTVVLASGGAVVVLTVEGDGVVQRAGPPGSRARP